MYSKQEVAVLTKQFWTSFGQYMKPITGSEGEEVNWLNYDTGIKDIFFRMEADTNGVSIFIELAHPDIILQHHYFTQLTQLHAVFEETVGEVWEWETNKSKQHKMTSRIGKMLNGLNILNTSDWPAMISFLKPRLIALDEFWNLVRESLL